MSAMKLATVPLTARMVEDMASALMHIEQGRPHIAASVLQPWLTRRAEDGPLASRLGAEAAGLRAAIECRTPFPVLTSDSAMLDVATVFAARAIRALDRLPEDTRLELMHAATALSSFGVCLIPADSSEPEGPSVARH